jgi:serine/threonine protein phosphatase 1
MALRGLTIEEPGSGTKFFAIGDIHGCYTALERLLGLLPISWGRDYLVFLGDYINRGPSPARVVEIILELKNAYPEKVIALKGNHEKMFEDYLSGIDREIFILNGGESTLLDYTKEGVFSMPPDHQEFFKGLYHFFETPDYFFVHGGVNPEKPFSEQEEEDLLWIRGKFHYAPVKFKKTVIFGHTPFSEPFVREDRIGIDTGCVYGGKLTAVELPDLRFFQVDCEKNWRV